MVLEYLGNNVGVDAVEQARTCAEFFLVHRRPCCRSLKAGYILKYNTQLLNGTKFSIKIKSCEIILQFEYGFKL